LAWAISEHLAKNVKCFTLFATHFHEITSMANELKNVKNYHLSSIVENGKLTTLFQVQPGPMLKSFGVEVAAIAQLPESVVFAAKNYLEEIEIDDVADDEKNMAKVDELLEKIKKGQSYNLNMIEQLLV
jgi:DNA mismatch repair ATPase MutS